MKSTRLLLTLFCGLAFSMAARSQNDSSDSTGLPGDNFSLQGALELFKKAGSPEEFEKLLNTESNHVNNLDLNGDGEIDYIRIVSKQEKDAHIFVLQVPVSASESQDIAVIELEKTGNENAVIQIVGDEDIYGEQTIIEPGNGETEESPGAFLDNTNIIRGIQPNIVVNVWFWPSVRFVYAPTYRVWVSPWKWRAYPAWWRPWRPLGWYAYRPIRARYYTGFAVVRTHRVIQAHRVYKPIRVTSVTVRTRNAVAVNNYRVTRTKTTVKGPRGNSVTRRTTTVQGRNGKVKSTHTTVRKRRRG